MGQTIRRTTEPVYAFNKLLIPVGTGEQTLQVHPLDEPPLRVSLRSLSLVSSVCVLATLEN